MRERDVFRLLHERYQLVHGNGQRFVTAEHVRSHAGYDARRTADFIAMDMWPSRGLALHGHEVKVTRSDWLSELRTPEKAQEFIPYMTYWWLVTSDPTIVVKGELPEGWGLMTVNNGQLRVVKSAVKNRDQKPLPLTKMACLMRATAKTAWNSRVLYGV